LNLSAAGCGIERNVANLAIFFEAVGCGLATDELLINFRND